MVGIEEMVGIGTENEDRRMMNLGLLRFIDPVKSRMPSLFSRDSNYSRSGQRWGIFAKVDAPSSTNIE